MFGVLIEAAPQDWQILQQKEGAAKITASGRYVLPPESDITQPVVYLRIVREDNGMPVVDWQPAKLQAGETWEGELTVPAGGLYRLETCLTQQGNPVLEWATRGDMRHHLGVGDLYVIAGQSNSAGYGKDPFYDPPELGVHLCRNSLRWDLATHPMNESTDMAHPANLEGCNPGASPYLAFGKLLRRELGYPIGLLQTSLGGSPLSQWNPEEDGRLYRSMMEVIASQGGSVRGVLWYQGCSDVGKEESRTYGERFTRVVRAFREEMGEDTPWLTVQLNRRLRQEEVSAEDAGWGRVREAQRQAARNLLGISIVPATDCGLSDGIHNSAAANVMLGERLAGAALRDIYHRPWSCGAPDLKAIRHTSPDTLELTFAPVAGRLFDIDSHDVRCRAFTVEDTTGKEIAVVQAELTEDTITLHLAEAVSGLCRVSAGWQMEPPVRLPLDFATHQPILSFYQVEAEEA